MFFLGAIYVINEIKFFYNFGNAFIVTLDHSEPMNTTQVLEVAIMFFSLRNKIMHYGIVNVQMDILRINYCYKCFIVFQFT